MGNTVIVWKTASTNDSSDRLGHVLHLDICLSLRHVLQ